MIDPNDFDDAQPQVLSTRAGYACAVCPDVPVRKSKLATHIREAHSPDPAAFQCPHCAETRAGRSRLAAHIYRVHRRSDRDNSSYDDAVNAAPVSARMDATKQDIMAMGQALTDIAERMQRLDDAATSPDAVRRSVLEEVAQRLVDAGDAAGYSIVRAMIREGI